jgi:aldehyde:ferredoxin oxidoreductase
MEAGVGEFGDVQWMGQALAEMRLRHEQGRLWAQGTARVGEHYGVQRIPVIKKAGDQRL